MKSKHKKPARVRAVRTLPSRIGIHPSAFVFVACLGIWLPRPEAAVLVDLDATQLAEGGLSTWTNAGTLGGNFIAPVDFVPSVTTLQSVKGVTLDGVNHYYTGPGAPAEVTRTSQRSIEAWIYNPAAADEETIFAWARRGGPDGSNMSFNHGLNPTFGAVGHWGAGPDLGWNGNISTGRWNYVAYTFDGVVASVYRDGALANSENVVLDTWDVNNLDANPLPFRVGSQNEADGTPTPGFRGSMTIAKIRVHDVALTAQDITNRFNLEKAPFGLGDTDNDGMPDWYEQQYAFLNSNNASDASLDQDSDGLTNLQEFQRGTNPNNSDTDGDTISDGAEVNRTSGGNPAPTNPLRADTDGDGLSDAVETGTGTYVSPTNTGTDPLKADTDDDTFGDQLEVLAGSNPNNANSIPPSVRPAVVILDATVLPVGPLSVWTNLGSINGVFNSSATVARVETVQGVKGVRLNPTGTANFYTGPAAPSSLTGTNSSRTVEAWINNPVAADEETVFSWGRRGGGPDGSNASFNHGLNAAFGAMGHWGAPDLGWNGPQNVLQGQWTYVVYTYDSSNLTTRVYSNGVEANFEVLPAPLNTHSIDTANRPLPFRIGSQNDANGNATGGLRGTMTIAELRVYDRVLDPGTILTNFNAGTDKYGTIDYDADGLPTWYERQYAFLNPNNSADASLDQDSDGLTNLQEFTAGTLPNNSDTDGDGVSDGAEVNRAAGATNPLRTDSDQDGLSDRVETGTGTFVGANDTGTDPLLPDTDGDTFMDGQEVIHGSNPTQVGSLPDFTPLLPLINLDATGLSQGPLATWTNLGPLGGVFTAPTNTIPNVTNVNGIRGVTFPGTAGNFYTGPIAPSYFGGNASRTVEAWIYNPALNTEESIFAWGRRGGPDGSNASFLHGSNAAFGAMGLWGGGPDVGWNGLSNIVVGAWTHVAYTYDAATLTAVAYKNGVQANLEVFVAPLITHLVDNTAAANPLPFRVGVQNNADGTTGGQLASLTIAKLRVYDQALSAQAITNKYNSEWVGFSTLRFQGITHNPQAGQVTLLWNSLPGLTYFLDSSTNLTQWTPLVGNLNTNSYSEPASASYKFYRLRAQ